VYAAASLSDVRNVERACRNIERETPWIEKAECPDFRPPPGLADERVVRWDSVGQRAHVDTKDLSQQRVEILSASERIATTAAVACSDVERSVGAELQLPAVVIRKHPMRDREDPDRRRLDRTGRRHAGRDGKREALDRNVARGIREVARTPAVRIAASVTARART
jgi:hypothetical protein